MEFNLKLIINLINKPIFVNHIIVFSPSNNNVNFRFLCDITENRDLSPYINVIVTKLLKWEEAFIKQSTNNKSL